MFASPIPAVIKACRSSKLAALNPLPYGWQVANSTGWIVYGMFIKNYFVALPNLFGVLLGNLYLFGLVSCCFSTPHTTTTTTTTTTPINNTLSLILLTGVFLPAVVLLEALIAFVSFPNETGQMILGISANVILFVYYMAPIVK